jgi:group I intron endonuclease
MIVYKTTNLLNGKIYIGSDINNNDNYLGSGLLLKRAVNKYGLEFFKKETLQVCLNKTELKNQETFWIRKLKPFHPFGYNISNGFWGGDTLSHHPNKDEIFKKASLSRTGTKRTQETKNKISISQIGKIISAETRGKISYALTGRHLSENVRGKIGLANKSRKIKEETRQKLSEINKGRKLSPETKQKIREKRKLQIITCSTSEKISKANIGRKWVNNGRVNRWVTGNELNSFLLNGWFCGRIYAV